MQSHSLDVFGAKREDTLRIFKVFLLLGSHIELVQIRWPATFSRFYEWWTGLIQLGSLGLSRGNISNQTWNSGPQLNWYNYMYLNIASTINPNMHTYNHGLILPPPFWVGETWRRVLWNVKKRRMGRDQCSALGYVLVVRLLLASIDDPYNAPRRSPELFNLGTLETQNCCILSFYITLHYITILC
jgi:hypothetical protein